MFLDCILPYRTFQLQDFDLSSFPPPFGLHVYCTVTVKFSLYFLIFFNILFSVKNIYLKFYYFIKKYLFYEASYKFHPFYEDATVAANKG